jgi:hypothetical protein
MNLQLLWGLNSNYSTGWGGFKFIVPLNEFTTVRQQHMENLRFVWSTEADTEINEYKELGPRKVWMDDTREAAGRRGKTIQEARSMAMTRKDFRRWTEDPTLKGNRER